MPELIIRTLGIFWPRKIIEMEHMQTLNETDTTAQNHAVVMPRIDGPVAESWVIARGVRPHVQWLTPEREWQGSIFEAARFELGEREKVEWWLQRELDSMTSA